MDVTDLVNYHLSRHTLSCTSQYALKSTLVKTFYDNFGILKSALDITTPYVFNSWQIVHLYYKIRSLLVNVPSSKILEQILRYSYKKKPNP